MEAFFRYFAVVPIDACCGWRVVFMRSELCARGNSSPFPRITARLSSSWACHAGARATASSKACPIFGSSFEAANV